MKKVFFALLLLMLTGAMKAEVLPELSNTKDNDNVSFTERVINGEITWNVFYRIRESDIENVDSYLKKIGEFLKDHHDCKISLKSYADKGTGNAKLNIMYSRLRSEKAVAALVAAGVNRKLITAEYFGDTVQPFEENDKNRVTIIVATGLSEIKEPEPVVVKDTVVVEQPVIVKDTVIVMEPVFVQDTVVVKEPVIVQDTIVVKEPIIVQDTIIVKEPVVVNDTIVVTNTPDEIVPAEKKCHVYFTPSSKKAIDNKHRWFIGANVGAQTYFGDHNRQTKFKDIPTHLITPAAEVYGGCWLNRFLAVRLDISGFNIKGLTYNMESQMLTGKDNPFATPNKYVCRTGETLDCQRFNYINTHADVLINLMQITKDGKEFFDLIPYVGFGWNVAWSPYHHSNHTNAWGLDMGAIFSWRLTEHWGLNLDAHGILIPDKLDGDGHYNGNKGKDRNNKYEGIPSLNLGMSYRF